MGWAGPMLIAHGLVFIGPTRPIETSAIYVTKLSQKSLDIILSDDYIKTIDLLLATRYNNVGYIYSLDYTKPLPFNIPLISRVFCNLAVTYEQSENYSKPEFYWKKGFVHHLQSMPNNTDATDSLFPTVAINLADHQKYAESID
ncbi:unnamed protein product [Rotaria sp. Silwood2]|nr:unnamed protein product [Rotaria sp. Silwood2]CAF4428343.1 unnamed protein product [Rotaria sp. Silwood2]